MSLVRRPDGKVVGEVQGDKFKRKAKGSIHKLESPEAWAHDVAVIQQAEQQGASIVQITDTESSII